MHRRFLRFLWEYEKKPMNTNKPYNTNFKYTAARSTMRIALGGVNQSECDIIAVANTGERKRHYTNIETNT